MRDATCTFTEALSNGVRREIVKRCQSVDAARYNRQVHAQSIWSKSLECGKGTLERFGGENVNGTSSNEAETERFSDFN